MFALLAAWVCMLPADTPKVFTFDEAVAFALEHHPAQKAALWDECAAEGLVATVRAASLPALSGNVILFHQSQAATVTQKQTSLQASLQLLVPLIAPVAWGDWRHADSNLEVARRRTRRIRRDIALAAADAYFDVVLAARLSAVGDNAVEQGRAHFKYAHTRFVGGVGTQLDELRADQDLAQSEEINVSAADNLLQKQAALGIAMGFDAAVAADPVQSMKVRHDQAPEQDDIEVRDDVREAVAAWTAARQVEDDGWRDYSPTLVLRGSPFYVNPPTAILPAWGWSAAVTLSIPFYDGGVRYGLETQRRSLTRERQASVTMARRVARSEVRAARAALALAERAREVAMRAGSAAHEAVALATQAYRGGTTDNLAVIDAQRSDRDAATAVAMAEDTVLRARLAYLAAVGMFPP